MIELYGILYSILQYTINEKTMTYIIFTRVSREKELVNKLFHALQFFTVFHMHYYHLYSSHSSLYCYLSQKVDHCHLREKGHMKFE